VEQPQAAHSPGLLSQYWVLVGLLRLSLAAGIERPIHPFVLFLLLEASRAVKLDGHISAVEGVLYIFCISRFCRE
jgi:hypothetical protein